MKNVKKTFNSSSQLELFGGNYDNEISYDTVESNSLSASYLDQCNIINRYKNDNEICFMSIETDPIPDNQNCISPIELLENTSLDAYAIKIDNQDSFNDKEFDKDVNLICITTNRMIIKMPSRMYIENEKRIKLKVRIVKNSKFMVNNLLLKFVSDDYYFSKSIINLDEIEKEITLTKKRDIVSYCIKIKIYMDNEAIGTKMINLLSRQIWE